MLKTLRYSLLIAAAIFHDKTPADARAQRARGDRRENRADSSLDFAFATVLSFFYAAA